ncbi:MAG: AmmeMemoRadiSam system protein B [Candidatus Obscuribacterales bacterium]|nr:AmmeMemoRadiSam system protein B [Candidatus Obscuribacterales bacterium]
MYFDFNRTRRSVACALMLLTMWGLGQNKSKAQIGIEGTRRPMYAGTWYEADPEVLKTQLQQFLSKATPAIDDSTANILAKNNSSPTSPITALIVPHAGYIYSGQAAAYAYKQVAGKTVKRVFLLAPSHYIAFQGAALPTATTYTTPLGDLYVDKEVVSQLQHYPAFKRMPEVHKVEHALEMQLPFIRESLGEVTIIPIVIGTLTSQADIKLMGELLHRYIGKDDLVVVSSDFTHFGPRYDYQPFTSNIKENIRKLDGQAYDCLSKLDLTGFLEFQEKTKDTICGFYPCCVLLSMLEPGTHATLLKYYTSQDTQQSESDNSVSYLAIAFSGKPWGSSQDTKTEKLSEADKQTLMKLARATLSSYVEKHTVPILTELGVTPSKALLEEKGAFVTLNKGKELRGCIGHIWPLKPLWQSVMDNAVSACSVDYRFNSVQPEELKDIEIEISVLTKPKPIQSYKDIVLGRDGIVLAKNGKQSVFLPFVATQFGWTLDETLTQLAKKAGLEADDWKEGAHFDIFQAEVFEEGKHN